jgi:hypothetical protein
MVTMVDWTLEHRDYLNEGSNKDFKDSWDNDSLKETKYDKRE